MNLKKNFSDGLWGFLEGFLSDKDSKRESLGGTERSCKGRLGKEAEEV
jgi:hypothetical protein